MDQATAALFGALIGGGMTGSVTLLTSRYNARQEERRWRQKRRLELLEQVHRNVARLANSDLRTITPEIKEAITDMSTTVSFVRVYFHPYAEPPHTRFAQALERFEETVAQPFPDEETKHRAFQEVRNAIRALAAFALKK